MLTFPRPDIQQIDNWYWQSKLEKRGQTPHTAMQHKSLFAEPAMRILIDVLPYTLLIAAMVARYFASTR
ncbi:hypothetical protein [Herbaspirillum sp. RV1423]|uniref:hypothetical protein n=1 Tax=Herbaspirillum sp. RV1423 TaxID=1443993 RepID=UPI0012DEE427|nr:hypothetical protein [Herbaspirillum sp. RV1423]